MKILMVLFIFSIFAATAGAVVWQSERRAAYDAQTEIAQAETEGIVAQAESQSEIAGYEASVDLAGINAQLEIAKLQMEIAKLDALIESEKVQAMLAQAGVDLAQINADLERARAERQRMWLMLILPGLAAIVIVVVALVVLVVVLRRPARMPSYPMITMRTDREIVPVRARPGVIAVTLVGTRKNVDHYEVRK